MRFFTTNIKSNVIFLIFFLLILYKLMLSESFLNFIKPLLIEYELISLEKKLEEYKNAFETKSKGIQTTLLTLSKNVLIAEIKNNSDKIHNQQWKEDVVMIFKAFFKANPSYLSLRFIFIDKTNYQQVINVNKDDGDSINVKIENSPVSNENDIQKTIQLKPNNVYFSNLFLRKTSQTNLPIIRIATPLMDNDAKPIAVIVAELNATKLLTYNHAIDSALYVFNPQGIYLFQAGLNQKSNSTLQHKLQNDFPETSSILTENNHFSTKMLFYPNQQQQRYTFVSKFNYSPHNPEYFLAFVLSETLLNLSKKTDNNFYKLIQILMVFIFICLFLSYFFIRKLTKPLQNLVSASNELGTDFSSINFPTDSNNELAKLAKSFENMNRTIIKQNESLKNSELRNHSIMNHMSDALMTITPEGLIYTFNTTAENVFSYSKNEIKGLHISTLIPELKKLKLCSEVEFKGKNKNGSKFPLEASITEMRLHYRKAEAKNFFIIVCRNITERKKAEKQLKRAGSIAIAAKEEAEKANEAKTLFLSRMSHEFRTPLNAVLGFSQILLMEENSNEFEPLIQPIYDSGNHLLEMVNDVLDISNMEIGEINLTLDIVELISTLKEVYQQALELAKVTETEIELLIKDRQAEIFINADKKRLKQILFNIISNSLKFNRDNGKIILSLCEVKNEKIEILIKDHGVGISKENLTLIFNPFERLNAYKLGVDGLGIGLTIAKQLTKKMKGVIRAESEKDVGSQFYVTFPVCQPDEKYLIATKHDTAESDISFPVNNLIRILYIEDDAINLAFMSKALGKYPNIKLIPANNPIVGINSVRKQAPDLVLLDLHLPEIHGFEVFKCLKSYQNMQNVPIIAITASETKKDIDKAVALGFYAYIIKPVKTQELYKIIFEALCYADKSKKHYKGLEQRKNINRRS